MKQFIFAEKIVYDVIHSHVCECHSDEQQKGVKNDFASAVKKLARSGLGEVVFQQLSCIDRIVYPTYVKLTLCHLISYDIFSKNTWLPFKE